MIITVKHLDSHYMDYYESYSGGWDAKDDTICFR